jgi:hypothetical protein
VVVVERRAKSPQKIGANFLVPSDELGEGIPLQMKSCQMHLFFLFCILSNKKFIVFVQPLGRLLIPIIFRERLFVVVCRVSRLMLFALLRVLVVL